MVSCRLTMETPIFNGKIYGFRLRFSLKPIHCIHIIYRYWKHTYIRLLIHMEVPEMGVPPDHPFQIGIFHEANNLFMGYRHLCKPPYVQHIILFIDICRYIYIYTYNIVSRICTTVSLQCREHMHTHTHPHVFICVYIYTYIHIFVPVGLFMLPPLSGSCLCFAAPNQGDSGPKDGITTSVAIPRKIEK